MKPNIKDILSKDEIARLTARSDARAWWAIARTWSLIGLALALLALWPNPLTFVVALILLGGQQLALAILTHEAAHRTLFKTRALNDGLTDWLCARPIWLDVGRYREHHIRHHAHTGTDRDPDMSLVDPFPTTRRSLQRKLLRDISGISGLRRMFGLLLMDFGFIRYNVAADVEKLPQEGRGLLDYARDGLRNFGPVVLSNLVLAALLMLLGVGWLYGVWVLANLTTYGLFLRIRSIAEHACMERGPEMWRNTRTTRAGWLARLTVAPYSVNYHKEHHLMASVPFYRLPELHRLLRERELTDSPPGYWQVLQTAGAA